MVTMYHYMPPKIKIPKKTLPLQCFTSSADFSPSCSISSMA